MNLKKPKFWNKNKPGLASYLLFPLTIFYRVNNFFLDNYSPKKNYQIKTICVGNIYLGGTGKTPSTIKIYNLLQKNFKLATAKKFYKNEKDEQIILNKKTQLICEKNRGEILKTAINNKYQLVIFDDGLQDRKIYYDVKIVCFNSDEWIGNGQLIPSGPLREKIDSLKKYDVIFIKDINSIKSRETLKIIKKINPKIKIYFTEYKILNLKKFDTKKKYLLFCGIGNPENFKKLLIKNKFNLIFDIIFPDHYSYNTTDFENILIKAKNLNAEIITTEKDYVKIPDNLKSKFKYLNVELKINNEKNLINFLKKKLNERN